ncbi:MAG: hypothetical protein M0P71_07385 [Melioribacteraceae bacterium]|jgi:hypothetical protein|nr:hypothetical protein [Melioribacteraceae bacterium]MDD3982823.1 hypothetical protein [Candidatus Omnitrophota bacterium]
MINKIIEEIIIKLYLKQILEGIKLIMDKKSYFYTFLIGSVIVAYILLFYYFIFISPNNKFIYIISPLFLILTIYFLILLTKTRKDENQKEQLEQIKSLKMQWIIDKALDFNIKTPVVIIENYNYIRIQLPLILKNISPFNYIIEGITYKNINLEDILIEPEYIDPVKETYTIGSHQDLPIPHWLEGMNKIKEENMNMLCEKICNKHIKLEFTIEITVRINDDNYMEIKNYKIKNQTINIISNLTNKIKQQDNDGIRTNI